jgi:phospholipid transport system substrate-binding protein
LARESLAEHWEERTPAERAEFASVLKRLVQNAYRTNLKKTLDYQVTFEPEQPIDKGVLVRTTAKHKKNKREEPLSVDYAVHRVGSGWRVFDIVTEGSSLVSNYRSQFRRVIKKKGFEQLLKDMKKKLEGKK